MTTFDSTKRIPPPSAIADVTALVSDLLQKKFPGISIADVRPLTPDASLRRYYRIRLAAPFSFSRGSQRLGSGLEPVSTCIAVLYDAVASPEATGFRIDSDDAYLQLATFFAEHGVSVPLLYADFREQSVFFLEDLGDRALIDVTRTGTKTEVRDAFLKAIDQINLIQQIPEDTEFFAFRRRFLAATYIREMEEFRDYCLIPASASQETIAVADALFVFLGAALEKFPQVLVHRDFHAWNLMVDPRDRVRVIDFQDALIATRPYDLVSLLNDRDMDAALGRELYRELVLYGATQEQDSQMQGGEDRAGEAPKNPAYGGAQGFLYQYDRVLLQRDLKVAGRFAKLVAVRGLSQYAQWIAGTQRRIGRTLERIIAGGAESPLFAGFLSSVSPVVPEVAAGAREPERFV